MARGREGTVDYPQQAAESPCCLHPVPVGEETQQVWDAVDNVRLVSMVNGIHD
jgi:hypothetical protein